MRNHHKIVLAIVLDHTRALQEAFLVFLTLEDLLVRALNHVAQVLLQLHHLTRTVDHIHTVVIVEEQ